MLVVRHTETGSPTLEGVRRPDVRSSQGYLYRFRSQVVQVHYPPTHTGRHCLLPYHSISLMLNPYPLEYSLGDLTGAGTLGLYIQTKLRIRAPEEG